MNYDTQKLLMYIYKENGLSGLFRGTSNNKGSRFRDNGSHSCRSISINYSIPHLQISKSFISMT